MPNLERLVRASATLELDHGDAKRTGLAWEHFATGLQPASARRWSAVKFNPRTYAFTQEPTRLQPFAARLDCKTVVFDTPYFDLTRARRVQGLVSWGAHDPGTPPAARPASLIGEIEARFGAYPAQPWIYGFTWPSPQLAQQMGEDLVRATRVRTEISQWLLGERLKDWQLGVVVVSELHSAIEALWHGVDPTHPLHGEASAPAARAALEGVYCAVDELIGTLLEEFADCAQLVFSMHGMGTNTSDVPAMALLPEWLYRRTFKQPLMQCSDPDPVAELRGQAKPMWSSHVWQKMPGSSSFDDHAAKKTIAARLHRKVRHLLSLPHRDHISWMPASWYADHWPQMPAFAMPAFYDGQIRLNVKGRERNGVVDPGDYDTLCQQLIADLSRCVDPATGKSAVQQTYVPHLGQPMAVSSTEADIVIVWQGAPTSLQTPDGDVIGPIAPRRPGGHTGGNGVACWHGDHFKSGSYGVRSSFDVVPSLVEYLGVSCGAPIDGRSFMPDILQNSHGRETKSSRLP